MFTYPPKEQPDIESLKLAQSELVRKHYQSRETAVLIPVLQSFVTALAVSGLAFLVWVGLKLPYTLLVTPGVFFLSFLGCWLGKMQNWNSLIWNLETSMKVDLDNDGYQGEPPPEPEFIKVQVRSEDGRTLTYGDLPVSLEKMVDFSKGILSGAPFSERQWSGSGALFSQGEFKSLRDALMSKGWARYRNPEFPQQGLEFSGPGRALLRTFANYSPTPYVGDRDE